LSPRKPKEPKYKEGRKYKVSVVFLIDGSEVESFLEKVKKHPSYYYCFLEEHIPSKAQPNGSTDEEEE